MTEETKSTGDMSLKELNAHYSTLKGAVEGTKFRKKQEAIDAIESLLTNAYTSGSGKGRKLFDCTGKKSEEIKAHRPGTKRDQAFQALRDGATFEEIQELCGWNQTDCAQGIKLLSTKLGYGLVEAMEGDRMVIRVTMPKGHKVIYLSSKTATPPSRDLPTSSTPKAEVETASAEEGSEGGKELDSKRKSSRKKAG